MYIFSVTPVHIFRTPCTYFCTDDRGVYTPVSITLLGGMCIYVSFIEGCGICSIGESVMLVSVGCVSGLRVSIGERVRDMFRGVAHSSWRKAVNWVVKGDNKKGGLK